MPNEITASLVLLFHNCYLSLVTVGQVQLRRTFFSVLEEKYDEKTLLYIVSVFTYAIGIPLKLVGQVWPFRCVKT